MEVNYLRFWDDSDTSDEIENQKTVEQEEKAAWREIVGELLSRKNNNQITHEQFDVEFRAIAKKRGEYLEDDPWNPSYRPVNKWWRPS